jgi:uncharacterized protein YbjT (DUF2867 family)
MTAAGGVVVVTGATGLQGRAVTRHLLENGWTVRALTRNAASTKAQRLGAVGAELMQGDMEDVASLRRAFAGAYGVFSLQNPFISGPDGEVLQGRNVADVAREAGVRHLVYGSAGTGQKGTGIPSWETKLQVEEHLKNLGLPLTVLRPMAFMELMTDKKFFPPMATWHVMPTLMGWTRPVPWLCADDLGAIAAKVFADPDRFISTELTLASDVQTLDQCRAIYREVVGRDPRRIPLPPPLFQRFGFAGKDLTTMWRWLRTATISLDTSATRAIHPEARTVRGWLRTQPGSAREART